MLAKSSNMGVINSTMRSRHRKEGSFIGIFDFDGSWPYESSLTKKIPEAGLMGMSSILCSDFSFLYIWPEIMQALSYSMVSSLKKVLSCPIFDVLCSLYKFPSSRKSERVYNFSLLV
jgi:undecaprenyl pyrophosphate phosphatase UppP